MAVSRPYEASLLEALKDPEEAALYLEEALVDGDMDAFKMALRNVAKARLEGGLTELAEVTDLNRETLYRTLSEKGNPQLDTLNKVLHAVGLRIAVDVDESQEKESVV